MIDINNGLIDVRSLLLHRTEASDIIGIAPETLNTLQEIEEAINNDANPFQAIDNQINLKRHGKTYVSTSLNNKVNVATFNDAIEQKHKLTRI